MASGATTLSITELPLGQPDWQAGAACRSEHAPLFFGPNQFEPKRVRLDREEAAKEICRVCPIIEPCREHALAQAELFGVWGGLTETERRAILADGRAVKKAD